MGMDKGSLRAIPVVLRDLKQKRSADFHLQIDRSGRRRVEYGYECEEKPWTF